MKYGQDDLKEMAEKINLVDYIGQTEELRRRGQNYFINCPFHKGDDTPSLCIYTDSQRWHCFGCNAGGDIYQWIVDKENVSFSVAVQKVMSLVGVTVRPHIENKAMSFFKTIKKAVNPESKQEITRTVLDWNRDYYDKYDHELPVEWLNEDMKPEALKEYYIMVDNSANRIVYPVLDRNGVLIGVKGRTRINNYKLLGLQKYMNYYKVGTLDYFQGWQQALPSIQSGKPIIIFEGIKSCIKAWGWGIKNTIASETAKLSDGQIELLIRNRIPEVIIGWDTDKDLQCIIEDQKIMMLKRFTRVSVIIDTDKLLDSKMAPVDKGEEIFRELLDRRIKI